MNIRRTMRTAIGAFTLLALFGVGSGPVKAGPPPKTKLTAAKAEAAALKKYKGGKIQSKTVLENEEGKWQYAVMVKAGGKLHEVMVNANTGKIDSEETVTAKEEAAEKKAEKAVKKGGKPKSGKG